MSKKNTASLNAVEVIERFGGIRPMSTKTNIPVTTIQGWKKRDSIPAGRVDEIIKAAQNNDVDISDLAENGGANQNDNSNVSKKRAEVAAKAPVTKKQEDVQVNEGLATLDRIDARNKDKEVSLDVSYDKIQKQIEDVESRSVQKSVLISSGIFVVVLAAIAILLWPKADAVNDKVAENSEQIAAIEEQSSGSGSGSGIATKASDLIPDSWQSQIDGWMGQAEELKQQAVELKDDAIAAKDQAQAALKKVEEISNDVLGAEAGTAQQRYVKLQEHMGEVMAMPQMSAFMEQMQSMGASIPGQEVLQGAQGELSGVLQSFSGAPEQLNGYLDQARLQSGALGQTFDGVPADDMKAAALLFTFNQMRSALNREGQPFGDDLELLKKFHW